MAPKATNNFGTPSLTNHTSGIYAAMDVDGPEIGTLVVVFDRAKNLPNLRTMGKQDPYCAARLGKEAKKTDTDRRGGQTPRWDQEIRFTVHDSLDYHKLKVSVFNDDKKTDLIGECWVDLEEVLRPGGGQGDSWHQLNIRGRYAGEIRIELTYYDTRPKVERPRKHSVATPLPIKETPSPQNTLGPRQPIGRRPLPTNLGNSSPVVPNEMSPERSGAIPNPPTDLRSFHTPPRPIDRREPPQAIASPHSYPNYPETQSLYLSQEVEQQPSYSTLHGEHYYAEPEVEVADDSQYYYTDDPAALQALEDQKQAELDAYARQGPAFPRHERVQTLAGSPNPRPLPPVGMPHAYSAPELGPHEQVSQQQQHYEEYTADDYDRQFATTAAPQALAAVVHNQSFSSGFDNADVVSGQSSAAPWPATHRPPPPPIHRNSAPSIPKAYSMPAHVQQPIPPPMPSRISAHASGVPEPRQQQARNRPGYAASPGSSSTSRTLPQSSYPSHHSPLRHKSMDSYDYDLQEPQINSYPAHLSRTADPMVQPRNEMSYDPRYNYDTLPAHVENYPQRPSPLASARPDPAVYAGQSTATGYSYVDDRQQIPREPIPIHKPRAISPSANPSRAHTTPRKSVSPHPSPDYRSSEVAYSPDSFNIINPTYSDVSIPNTSQSLEPTPMYTSPVTAPTQATHQPVNPEAPIIGADGRIKDPSDHLPLSSYAPEPERKGDKPRASTVINVKNRFGPREAGSSPLSSRPVSLPPSSGYTMPSAEQRNRLSKRASGTPSSPLAPAQSSILNYGGGNQSSAYPPPVPGKIPLHQSQLDDYAPGGKMVALASEIQGIDLGPNVPRNGAGRPRKSRYGA